MKGEILDNDLLEEVSDIIQIPKVRLKGMEVKDIIYHVKVLTIPINDLSVYEDENEIDTERSREILNYLNERINDPKQ
jgi:hypothetical protein